MGTEVSVDRLPACDWCGGPAHYDFKTRFGPWAYGCDEHYSSMRLFPDLGTGKGQKLVERRIDT